MVFLLDKAGYELVQMTTLWVKDSPSTMAKISCVKTTVKQVKNKQTTCQNHQIFMPHWDAPIFFFQVDPIKFFFESRWVALPLFFLYISSMKKNVRLPGFLWLHRSVLKLWVDGHISIGSVKHITWNPNDLCFGRKRPCFAGLTFKNRGPWASKYIYI